MAFSLEVIKPENKLNNADIPTANPSATKIKKRFNRRLAAILFGGLVFSDQIWTKWLAGFSKLWRDIIC